MEDNEWALKKVRRRKKERDGEFHLESCKEQADGDTHIDIKAGESKQMMAECC